MRQAANSSAGVRPSIEVFLTPREISRFSPLMRFMKNSSCSMPRMPANFTRSSSGSSSVAADRKPSCSTTKCLRTSILKPTSIVSIGVGLNLRLCAIGRWV